jgi:uncharacterized protein YjbJ (UPF0337 family)
MAGKNTAKGAAKETAGKVKEAVGKTTGSDKLVAEGKGDRVEGKAQKTVGKVSSAARSALKKTT